MNVLVVGNGAREHAIAWKISQGPSVGRLYVAPGNAGTHSIATNVPVGADDIAALIDFASSNAIDLTVVGPEAPLASGIVDSFTASGLPAFGPTQAAARIEGSHSPRNLWLIAQFQPQLPRRSQTSSKQAHTSTPAQFLSSSRRMAWLQERA